jgi:Flp pilus assembly protein TadG
MKFPFVPAGIARRVARQLRRLGEDRRGNAFIIVAAAVVPMLALVGGGIDMSRGYLSRTRLQQACDAGVLATRKKLGSTVVTNSVIPTDARQIGERFFNLNYQDGAYGSTGRTFTQTFGSDYSINGTATVNVPTTLMRLFGSMNLPVTVTCTAQFNYANSDIMMVLDVTGSMLETNSGDSKSRMAVMKQVVKDFYATVEAGRSQDARIRYGFVPYSTNVNVGFLLKSAWMVNSNSYETRSARNVNSGWGTEWRWRYSSYPISVSSLKGSTNESLYRGGSITFPDAVLPSWSNNIGNAQDLTVTYGGCIEERATYVISDYNNVDLARARDLDIDAVPVATNADTQWRPALRESVWLRNITITRGNNGVSTGGDWGGDVTTTTSDYGKPASSQVSTDFGACPSASRKLGEMTSTQLNTYVDGLQAVGSTYHDLGMIWGGRLLSPTGIFASENAEVNDRPTVRHLIFLTDGETSTSPLTYGPYGVEPLSNRRWNSSSPYSLTQTVEKRFTYACNQVKNRNITVWVIGFGDDVSNLNQVMKDCAGSGRWFQASNATQLSNAFSAIAAAIGDLRITK